MSRTLSPPLSFASGSRARALIVLSLGAAALALAAPAGANHRDRPHAPKKVRAVDVGAHSVELRWKRSQGARVYRLYRDGETVRWKRPPRAYEFVRLACDRTYRLGVRAYDGDGDRSPRRTVRVRTRPCEPRNVELPAVLGTPEQGATLSASPGTWRGDGPLTYTYEWLRCIPDRDVCSSIWAADDQTYAVREIDEGRTLRVRVRAQGRDGAGSARSRPVGPVDGGSSPDPEPEPDPDPEPDPEPSPGGACTVADTSGCVPGTTLTLRDEKFLCDRPLSRYGQLPLEVVVTFTPGRLFGGNGAIDLYTGCAGDGDASTIDLIVDVEGDGTTYGPGVDAFKVRQQAGYTAGIQLTGHVDCGPKYTPYEHQDGVQLQGGRNIAFVDFSVGDYANGRSTCQGAGGAFFYSGASGYLPTNIDVVRGSYIACNHSLFVGGGTSGDIVGARFRSGRNDGSDPFCTDYHASPACDGEGGTIDPDVRLTDVTCQRWNRTTDRWE